MQPALLKHALMGFFEIWAKCDSCGNERKLDELALSVAKGQQTPVERIRARCQCGKRGTVFLKFPRKVTSTGA
jgi:hypothetical protein